MPSDSKSEPSDSTSQADMFKAIAAEAPQGIIVVQGDKVLYANAKLSKLIGFPLKEIYKWKTRDFIKHVFDADRGDTAPRLKTAIRGEVKTRLYQLRIKNKKGEIRWFQVLPRAIQVHGEAAILAIIIDITDTKKTELAYQELVDHSLQGIIIIQDGKVVYSNQAFADMSGYSIEEILALSPKQVQERVHPDYQARVWGRLQDRLEGKSVPSHYSFKAIRKDGEERWMELYATVIDFDGRPAVQATLLDITERQEADIKLQESEARYRTLFNDVPVGLYRTTPEGEIVDANPALVRILGANDREVLLKLNAADFYVNVEEREQWHGVREQTTIIQGHEVQFRRIDDKIIWVRDSFQAVKDDEGNTLYFEGTLEDITERKLAEEALRESEAKYRAVIEQSLQGYVIFQDEQVIFANSRLLEILHVSLEDIQGWTPSDIWEVIHSDDRPILQQRLQDRFSGKPVPDRYEFRIQQEDGTITWLDVEIRLIDYQGKPAIQAALMDVTERKLTDEAIRESEAKFRNVVEQSLQGIVISQGLPPRIYFANEAFCKMIGYTIEELLAMPPKKVKDMIHPADRELVLQRVNDRLKGKPALQQYEYRMLRKDGAILWVEVFATLIEFEGVPAIQAAYVDITERKEAEAALQESEEKFRALVEELSDWVWEMDLQGKILYSNNAVEDILGFSAGQVVGRTPCDFLRPEDVDRAQQTFNELKEKKRPIRTLVIKFVHRDESDVMLEARGRPVLDDQGEIIGFRGICRDITDRLKMIEQLRHLEEGM